MSKPRICVDFDKTITTDHEYRDEAELQPGVKEALTELQEMGFRIAIYSCRNNPEVLNQARRMMHMRDTLDSNGIPYDEIIMEPKPIAVYYIDDSAVRFTDWDSTMEFIRGKKYDWYS